jgi:hypothetical protein
MSIMVIFTKHALSRLEQRFRLYLNPKVSTEQQAVVWFNRSSRLNEWMMSPFYLNKMRTKHGNREIYKYNIIYFIVSDRKDYKLVLTVVKDCSYDFLNKKITAFLGRGIDTDY